MGTLAHNLVDFMEENNLQQVDQHLDIFTQALSKISWGDKRFHNSDDLNLMWNFMGRHSNIQVGNILKHQINAESGFYKLKRDLGIDETTEQLLITIPASIEDENYLETKYLIKEVENRIDLTEKKFLEIIHSEYKELRTGGKKSNVLSDNIIDLSPSKHQVFDDWLEFRKNIRTQFKDVDELIEDIDKLYPFRHPVNVVDYILLIKEIIEGLPHIDPNSRS